MLGLWLGRRRGERLLPIGETLGQCGAEREEGTALDDYVEFAHFRNKAVATPSLQRHGKTGFKEEKYFASLSGESNSFLRRVKKMRKERERRDKQTTTEQKDSPGGIASSFPHSCSALTSSHHVLAMLNLSGLRVSLLHAHQSPQGERGEGTPAFPGSPASPNTCGRGASGL
ncbi:hypothetical protein DPEC_G00261710 [Dallia pectoralis]|uniref:Uncharacterized protein n=1 Tax=Dallia pectoralis TaxID=75939 RepID=A0ACC2FRH4_DALPE|nr:hypothetical protein DPEC_G00261710 [Dallia pectoralis]